MDVFKEEGRKKDKKEADSNKGLRKKSKYEEGK